MDRMSEVEKYKLMLFMVVRNNVILSKGTELGKTQKEISKMTIETMEEIKTMIDFRIARGLYELGEKK